MDHCMFAEDTMEQIIWHPWNGLTQGYVAQTNKTTIWCEVVNRRENGQGWHQWSIDEVAVLWLSLISTFTWQVVMMVSNVGWYAILPYNQIGILYQAHCACAVWKDLIQSRMDGKMWHQCIHDGKLTGTNFSSATQSTLDSIPFYQEHAWSGWNEWNVVRIGRKRRK